MASSLPRYSHSSPPNLRYIYPLEKNLTQYSNPGVKDNSDGTCSVGHQISLEVGVVVGDLEGNFNGEDEGITIKLGGGKKMDPGVRVHGGGRSPRVASVSLDTTSIELHEIDAIGKNNNIAIENNNFLDMIESL
jgi:hypothetical protein